jgi:hypothetical protein
MKDAHGTEYEWIIRSNDHPVALAVAVTSQADGNQVGLLAFVALIRSFAPTFHPIASRARRSR